MYGTAGTGGLGTVVSSSLENSTVDLATELTQMIEAQSAYQANSKVFQTGADLLRNSQRLEGVTAIHRSFQSRAMSLSAAYNIINSAFLSTAAQSAVISSNISNASTPGYSREIANVLTNSYGGSDVASVTREANSRAARTGQCLDLAGGERASAGQRIGDARPVR